MLLWERKKGRARRTVTISSFCIPLLAEDISIKGDER